MNLLGGGTHPAGPYVDKPDLDTVSLHFFFYSQGKQGIALRWLHYQPLTLTSLC